MNLIGFIIPTFLVLVLVGTVWAAGVAWGLDNRWPVALFIGAGLAGAFGGVQPVLAVALAVVLWAASFIWGSVIAWKVNKRWPAYLLLAASVLLIVIVYLMRLVI